MRSSTHAPRRTGDVFVPFAVLYMKEKPSWDYLWAALCMFAAVWFVFRPKC